MDLPTVKNVNTSIGSGTSVIRHYDNKKKCAKSPRDHFIDPQTQATSVCMENDHGKSQLLNLDD